MATEASMKSVIELLADTPTVRAYRIGSDYQIECFEGYTDEDFDTVIDQLGLEGRTNYEWSYVPETGMEIMYLPMLQVEATAGHRNLGMGVGSITAGLVANASILWELGNFFL